MTSKNLLEGGVLACLVLSLERVEYRNGEGVGIVPVRAAARRQILAKEWASPHTAGWCLAGQVAELAH